MLYKIAEDQNIECWLDDANYYLTSVGLQLPFMVKKHTYDIPVRHIMLGELQDDGLALIHEYKTNKELV